MGRANNINGKETSYRSNIGAMREAKTTQNCGKTCGKVYVPTAMADYRAQVLVDKFNAPQCRLFFLKCIYHLPEATIESAVEMAMRSTVKSHIRYFTVVAKRELARIGY